MNEYQPYVHDLETLRKEVTIEPYRSRGPGGQRKNKRETAVRLRYSPYEICIQTGKKEIVVLGTGYRSQAQNIDYALKELQRRLEKLQQPVTPRISTVMSSDARDERKQDKIHHSEKKRLRREPIPEED